MQQRVMTGSGGVDFASAATAQLHRGRQSGSPSPPGTPPTPPPQGTALQRLAADRSGADGYAAHKGTPRSAHGAGVTSVSYAGDTHAAAAADAAAAVATGTATAAAGGGSAARRSGRSSRASGGGAAATPAWLLRDGGRARAAASVNAMEPRRATAGVHVRAAGGGASSERFSAATAGAQHAPTSALGTASYLHSPTDSFAFSDAGSALPAVMQQEEQKQQLLPSQTPTQKQLPAHTPTHVTLPMPMPHPDAPSAAAAYQHSGGSVDSIGQCVAVGGGTALLDRGGTERTERYADRVWHSEAHSDGSGGVLARHPANSAGAAAAAAAAAAAVAAAAVAADAKVDNAVFGGALTHGHHPHTAEGAGGRGYRISSDNGVGGFRGGGGRGGGSNGEVEELKAALADALHEIEMRDVLAEQTKQVSEAQVQASVWVWRAQVWGPCV
eukprot:213072-Chlamydomonas_euryale.AAC.1